MYGGKSYRFFGDYLRDKFGCRVLKLPINAGLSCPNRNSQGGGCIFCAEDGSAAPHAYPQNSITSQMDEAKNNFRRADEETKFVAYFQAYTNTYSSVTNLKKLYNEALNYPNIVGLMIATRPDCLPDNIIDVIGNYCRKDFELWVEIGMQSCHDKSLNFLNRKHSHKETVDAARIVSSKGIKSCMHIILGIPGETWHDMMATAEEISSIPVSGIKLHHLHVINGTKLDEMYKRKEITLLSMQEYVSTVCDFIERLRPDILVHRLLGDRNKKSLCAPLWGQHKGTVIKAIEDEFERRVTYQGFLYNIKDGERAVMR